MSIKTFMVMAAMLLLIAACSKDEGDIQTKDVSFLFPVKCNELHISDSYAGEIMNTIHLADVDTAVVMFKGMKYGTHNIVMTADGITVSRKFTVSDSTQNKYEFSPLTISIVVDDKWDGEITYEAQ